MSADVDAALRTALKVGLHELFDPDCDGSPPYELTSDIADALVNDIMRMPVIRAAIRAETGALDDDDRAFLRWVHERFAAIYHESPNLDWMQRLARLAGAER